MTSLEEKVKEVYNKPRHCLWQENALLTTKVLKIFQEENISVSNAIRVLEESAYVLKEIAKI